MASSETKQRAISLGELLLANFEKADHDDILTRWMACYLGEQMAVAETATGADKEAAEERCFKTILQLWENRRRLPNGCRPFEDFEPILDTLERLDPENGRGFYPPFRLSESDAEESPVRSIMSFIAGVDRASRIMIDLGLAMAVEEAENDQTREILSHHGQGSDDKDVEAIRILVERSHLLEVEEDGTIADNLSITGASRLQGRIEELDRFLIVCGKVRSVLSGLLQKTSE